ncbi:Eco57I restriction-modification methylase domain-containing protein [uncultured Fusobacterium sp.]|uniref:Eco57I restriction-modification methylase domain-containing protein n=1 Tax=uncultured Fusobacterium sp. TaxID=159267 RepID=UPI0025EB0D28|nr:Eco57I restriction-modification methylase domain-containing protein [uncultured Fusobacterium sp.]
MTLEFKDIFEYKLIYIFSINTESHRGILKIGDTTLRSDKPIDKLFPNCKELNEAANERIKKYTITAGVKFNLLYTELAVKETKKIDDKGNEIVIIESFRDYDVHKVLLNSNIKKMEFENKGREWFKVDLEVAKKAIEAVKEGRASLKAGEIEERKSPINFRPEQVEAIEKTLKHFKKGKSMLWNAKMRFGKTLTALEVARKSDFKKTIIVTHRPVVNDGWYEDFGKIFFRKNDKENYDFSSKTKGEPLKSILKSGKNLVYFASIQDLRGSNLVGGKFDKNDEIFKLDWDFVIVDEAHEGTTTQLGNEVIKALIKENTKLLSLSGTPFNILDNYEDDAIYTWDYVMEQEAKRNWFNENYGDSNPYDDLPEMKIYTYSLGELLRNKAYVDLEDKAFNFREFFRVWTGDKERDGKVMPEDVEIGSFYHADDVKSFLKLLTKGDEKSHYPYSREEYRNIFKHTLWVVPGVKEAKALSELMRKDEVFGNGMFEIVNIAGDGDEEDESEEALKKVRKAINEAGDNYTITLTCGKLTTGVTIPQWTAVFMLAGSYSTSASSYLQTIFRVQSPYKVNGKSKRYCYVFDFAPDRTLKMVSEAVALSSKAGKTKENDRVRLGKFLNFCPVISIKGTEMKEYDSSKLLQQLKRAYAEKAIKNGFDDNNLYNDELLKLDELEIEEFNNLRKIVGTTKASEKTKEIDINKSGFTEEEYEKLEKIEKKKKLKEELNEEELEFLEKKKKQQDEKRKAISILRGISIRMPLLIYGIDIDINDDISMKDLVENIDDSSWEEFMPTGVTKEKFKFFMKYYDKDVFVAAGRRIRATVLGADEERPLERIKKIVTLFSYFKNPDKETVLTPWRVVNMHMGDCLGGYNFFDEKFENTLEEPRFINKEEVTENIFGKEDSKLLEINSKTGLYPLYLTYSLFIKKCEKYSKEELTKELENKLWLETVEENIYVICKTPMARSITIRTLVGFKYEEKIRVNAHCFDNLINMFQNKPKQFIERVTNLGFWNKKGNEKMKFDAIVGNPPYQENVGSETNVALSKQLFPYFIINAIELQPKYISLITPSRWFTGKAQDGSFLKLREYLKKNNYFKEIYNYNDNKYIFKNVTIGSINYFLCDTSYKGDIKFYEISNNKKSFKMRPLFEKGLNEVLPLNIMVSLVEKIMYRRDFNSLLNITTGRNPYGVYDVNKKLEEVLSANRDKEHTIQIICAYGEKAWISPSEIKRNFESVSKYKVFISKMNGGAGLLMDEKSVSIIGKSYIGYPNSICSGALIALGSFDTLIEAINLSKYMETKFLRVMVGVMKSSQALYQNVYQFVPLQDFTDNSDINWNKSINEIDEELFTKYGLSDEEKEYIRNKIKDMV